MISIPNEDKTTEHKKNTVLDALWLTYYNDTLYAKGIITAEDHDKMRIEIKSKKLDKRHI